LKVIFDIFVLVVVQTREMEKLTEKQRQSLTKMADARLVQKLLQAGVAVEKLELMDRTALLAAMAQLVAAGKEPSAAAASVSQVAYDVELEKLKFEWQKQCYEREQQEKQEMLRLEQQKLEAQQLLEKQKLEAQTQEWQERLRWEQKKTEMELQAKREDQERQERAWRVKADEEKEEERKRSNAARAKLFGDAMRNASVRMGRDPIEVIPFFESTEHLFDVFEVPNNLKVDLLRPYLSERAVKLLSQLDAGKLNDYNDVKRYILSQFRLSPRLFLEKFNNAVRHHDETAVLFASRLKTLLKHYLDSRKITTFDELFSLLICDRIKAALAEDCLNYVLSAEGLTDNGWIECDKLTDIIDMYYANRVNGRPSAEAIGAGVKNRARNFGTKGETRGNGQAGKPVMDERVDNARFSDRRGTRSVEGREAAAKCWHCQGPHLKRDCPRLGPVTNQGTPRSTGMRPAGTGGNGKTLRCNQAVVQAPDAEPVVGDAALVRSNQCVVAFPVRGEGLDHCELGEGSEHRAVLHEASECVLTACETVGGACLQRSTVDTVDSDEPRGNLDRGSQASRAAADREGIGSQALQHCVEALTYVDVMLQEVPGKVIRSLNDSGSQLSIVNKEVLRGHAYPICGSVKIRGLLGAPATAELTYLTVRLAEKPECSVRIMCAVSSDVYEELILPAAVVARLNDQYNKNLTDDSTWVEAVVATADADGGSEHASKGRSKVEDVGDDSDVPTADHGSDFLDVEQVDDSSIDPSVATVATLQREQRADRTLAGVGSLHGAVRATVLSKTGCCFAMKRSVARRWTA
jgi:hypothetical protein